MADAYPFRVPYPDEVFDFLLELINDEPRVVLDLGTGTGDIARRMAPRVERVDAVDVSAAMIAKGKALGGGDAGNLTWIEGKAEEARLTPPYALVTAGESLHWMDWEVLLPRLAGALTPNGCLAIVQREEQPPPWQDALMDLIISFSKLGKYQEYDLAAILESRGLFQLLGRRTVEAQHTEQPVDDYLRSFHSRASLSGERLGPDGVRDFDDRLRETVRPWAKDGVLALQWAPSIVWGRPLEGAQAR